MNIDVRKILSCFALIALFSCSSEKAPEVNTGGGQDETESVARTSAQSDSANKNEPYALLLSPVQATRNSSLAAIPRGFSLNDVKIEWAVNGRPSTVSGAVFNASGTKKGDRVQAKATLPGREIVSNIVEIKNAPPELTRVKIMPEVFKPGDTLNVEAAASDADGDAVSILFEWTRNGEPAGKGRAIESPVKRGDKITVKVTPFDGESYGSSIVLKRELLNLPPMITEQYKVRFDEKRLSCQINATDPDGDPLVYSLKDAPPGMTINPTSGLITWDVPRDFRGTASVTACVNDGHRGESTHTFNIDIRP